MWGGQWDPGRMGDIGRTGHEQHRDLQRMRDGGRGQDRDLGRIGDAGRVEAWSYAWEHTVLLEAGPIPRSTTGKAKVEGRVKVQGYLCVLEKWGKYQGSFCKRAGEPATLGRSLDKTSELSALLSVGVTGLPSLDS